MNPQAMEPFGNALVAYFEGDTGAEVVVRRDDGLAAPIPVSHFFREESGFTEIEKNAIALCKGHILDIGAGTGLHSMVLQGKGCQVTAIDISPQAAGIMKMRGVKDVRYADVFEFDGGPFDTLLMLGHGIGMAESMVGLDRFLSKALTLLTEGGQVIMDSLDVRMTDSPANLAYHEANRKAGRYFGEVRMQFEFRGMKGPFCGWLQVDDETMSQHAGMAGWQCEIIQRDNTGDYLARLTRKTG